MYDKLIKKLRESCESCKLWDGYKCCLKGECSAQKSLQAADAIEELQGTKCPHYIRNVHDRADDSLCDKWMCEVASLPKWIPVTERLPEKYDRVLVYSKATRMGRDIDFINSDGNWFSTQKVSHWMPLPQPPKDDES